MVSGCDVTACVSRFCSLGLRSRASCLWRFWRRFLRKAVRVGQADMSGECVRVSLRIRIVIEWPI